MHLSDAQVAEFEKEGYLFLPECFTAGEAATLRAAAEVVLADPREGLARSEPIRFAAQTYNEVFGLSATRA